MKSCPPKNDYERMLENLLSEDAELRLAEHLEGCPACQQLLESLTSIGDVSNATRQASPSSQSEDRSDNYGATSGDQPRELAALLPLVDLSQADTRSEPNLVPSQPSYSELEIPGYELLGELGRGGMGVVYQARDTRLNRLVAIKYLRAVDQSSAEQQVRFRMESETIASLSHPNIVQLYEVGSHRGRPFYVMEYIDGGNLAERVRTTPQDAQSVAELAETITRAIAYAHSKRVVHRDLKPANILLTEDDGTRHQFNRPRIADFGLARNLDASHLSLTDTGLLAGTPNYMAPEQIQGSGIQISPSTDIYAIGAIIYHLLTGRPPFLATSVLDTISQLGNDDPISPRQLEPSVPRDLEVICLKCLRKDPQKRYAAAEALADDLERFRLGQPIYAKSTTTIERLWRLSRRNPITAGLTVALLALLVFALVGSTIYSNLLVTQLDRAEQAEGATSAANRKVMETLFDSYLEQARISRLSGRVGQRSKSLSVIRQAAQLEQELGLGAPSRLLLRNEAIASLALTDFRLAQSWKLPRPTGEGLGIDPNLPRYAVCNKSNEIEIRSVVDNQLQKTIPCSQAVQALRFCPNNTYLAGVSWADAGSKCFLWNLQTDELVFETTHEASELALAFSPKSDQLAIGLWSGHIRVYDIQTGIYRRPFALRRNPNHLQFAPTRPFIAIANQVAPLVEIGNTETGEIVAELVHPAAVRHVSWSRNGRMIATGCDDNHIYIWDANTMELKSKLDGHDKNRIYLAFNSEANRLLSQSPDGTTRFWDPFSGNQLVRLETRSVFQWHEEDSHVAGASAGRFERWESLEQGEFSTIYHGDVGNESARSAIEGLANIAYHPSRNLLLSAGFDGVRLWDTKTRTLVAHLPMDANCTATFHPDGGITWLNHGQLRHLPFPNTAVGLPEAAAPFALPVRPYFGAPEIAFDQTGETFALNSLSDNAIIVGKMGSNVRHTVDADRPQDIALSPDGGLLAVATLSQLFVKNLATQENVLEVQGRFDCVDFHPDGSWLIAGNPTRYQLWNIEESGLPQRLLNRPSENIHAGAVAYSQCGRFLALAIDRQRIKLFDAKMSRELAELRSPETNLISHLRFHANSSQLAVANGDHTVDFWDLNVIDQQLAELGLAWDREHEIASTSGIEQSHQDTSSDITASLARLADFVESSSSLAHSRNDDYDPLLTAEEEQQLRAKWLVVDEECRRDPSPGNRLARGWLNGQLGAFDAAALDWAATIRPDTEENWDLFRRSILRLYLGDHGGHRRDCRRIFDGISESTHPVVYERVARSLSLSSELSEGDRSCLNSVMRAIEGGLSHPQHHGRHLFSRAISHLRQNQHAQSIAILQLILDESVGKEGMGTVQAHLYLAFNLIRTENAGMAEQHLQQANQLLYQLINKRPNETGEHWDGVLTSLILLRQVEAALSLSN